MKKTTCTSAAVGVGLTELTAGDNGKWVQLSGKQDGSVLQR